MKIGVVVVSLVILAIVLAIVLTQVKYDVSNNGVACLQDAKICPDGVSAGRSGPTCEFPSCPKPAQIANPASVNCIDKSGTLKILDSPQGQYGVCTLPNGTVCEEWALFRGECS